jgi:hypothetical protein
VLSKKQKEALLFSGSHVGAQREGDQRSKHGVGRLRLQSGPVALKVEAESPSREGCDSAEIRCSFVILSCQTDLEGFYE